jgi:zinc protease
MRHTFTTLVLAMLALAGCSQPGRVSEQTLANGLRVIVKEDHRSPVAVAQIWYRVGAVDEPAGLTGISHVLEHMMFKGTERLKPNEFSRIIAEHGGRENAFTGHDYTAYFQQLERSRLAISFELETERMRNLTLDPAEFAKEIKVVMEERRLRTEDQPEALLYEKFMNTAYRVHSYRNPIIGWMADLERMRVEDLRAWYARWYAPANATLVVVGDVDPREVFALAARHYGALPARPVKPVAVPAEPPQDGERRVRLALPAEVAHVLMSYHVPVLGSGGDAAPAWEPYALAVLVGVLDGGDSARLQKELVRDQRVAAEVGAEYSPIARAPGLLTLSGRPAAGRDAAALEQALRAQVGRLRDQPVSDTELRRIKAQVMAHDVYGRDSVFYQAMQLGRLATTGLDVRLLERFVERVDAVTAEQVRAVARKYLTDANLTVAVLDPLPLERSKSRAAPRPGVAHAR